MKKDDIWEYGENTFKVHIPHNSSNKLKLQRYFKMGNILYQITTQYQGKQHVVVAVDYQFNITSEHNIKLIKKQIFKMFKDITVQNKKEKKFDNDLLKDVNRKLKDKGKRKKL